MNQMIISDKNQVETEVNFDEEDLMVSIFFRNAIVNAERPSDYA